MLSSIYGDPPAILRAHVFFPARSKDSFAQGCAMSTQSDWSGRTRLLRAHHFADSPVPQRLAHVTGLMVTIGARARRVRTPDDGYGGQCSDAAPGQWDSQDRLGISHGSGSERCLPFGYRPTIHVVNHLIVVGTTRYPVYLAWSSRISPLRPGTSVRH